MANLLDRLANLDEFTTFDALVRKTPLAEMLTEPGPYTVFAPTDDAFDNLPEGAVNRLLQDAGKLSAILAYHVVSGSFRTEDAARLSSSVTTIEGSDLRIAATDTELALNGARIVHPDLIADNGVLHGIDQVLIPLDDLGDVVVEYRDVMVVAPETMVVVSPAPALAGKKTSAASAEETNEIDDIDL